MDQNSPGPEPVDPPLDQSLMLSLVGYNCRRAFAAIEPYFGTHMAQYLLRPGDFAVISLLKANPNISQKRVAQGINVAPPNLAPILDRLEARGLIVRQRTLADKRFQTFALTEAGLQLGIKAEKTAVVMEDEATKVLTDEERVQLIRLLQKIYLRN